jgi:pimeloyl-ACP methyl ester carboxylesterase
MSYVTTNGIRMHFHEKGEGDPLILIMGFGADGSIWEEHVIEYSQHFRCIMLDNRGVGLTVQPNGPYSTEMMADDTAGLMDALGIASAPVAGISMGGAISQQLALRHPDRVTRLLLISTWARFDAYATMVYENLKKLRKTSDRGDFMELLHLWIFASDYVGAHLEDLKDGQEGARNDPNPQSQEGFDGQIDACINHDSVDQLPGITVPTFIIVGEADIFTPLAFSKLLHEKISDSSIWRIPRTGHACHWEALEDFNRRTMAFLLGNE